MVLKCFELFVIDLVGFLKILLSCFYLKYVYFNKIILVDNLNLSLMDNG